MKIVLNSNKVLRAETGDIPAKPMQEIRLRRHDLRRLCAMSPDLLHRYLSSLEKRFTDRG